MVLVVLALVFSLFLGVSLQAWCGPPLAHGVSVSPKEPMSSEQLFQCMLSANFALLMRDDFNQLASSLPERRVREMLGVHWRVASADECRIALEARLRRLGLPALATSQDAGRPGEALCIGATANDYAAVLAWDIQQAAYLVRLARSVDFLSRESAQSILEKLAERAQVYYSSWSSFSLAALVGLRLRGPSKMLEASDWTWLSGSHMQLLGCRANWPSAAAGRSVA